MDERDAYYPVVDDDIGLSWDDLLGLHDGRDLDQSYAAEGNQWGLQNWDTDPDIYLCPLDTRTNGNYQMITYEPTQSYLSSSGDDWNQRLGNDCILQ